MPEPVRFAFSIAGIILIIIACYYTTYYISKKASGRGFGKNRGFGRNINLLERFAVSKDKSFCIIEVAGKVYIVGIANQSMTLLDTLDSKEFKELSVRQAGAANQDRWTAAQSGQLSGGLINRFASFIANKIVKPHEKGSGETGQSGSFADTMRSARENDISGRTDNDSAERKDGPEGE